MSVFVIADLHLSHSAQKPMDVFGPRWENHTQKLLENWQATVKPTDTVVIAGDISWGLRTQEALEDLRFIQRLNGKKIIAKGNHDFWWQTMKKLYEIRDSIGAYSIDFLYNNAYVAENYIICGTRGWFPESNYGQFDEKIVNREAQRLRSSILAGLKLKELYPQNQLLVFLHYPPAYGDVKCTQICDVLLEFGIKRVFYGHLHGVQKNRLVHQIAGAGLTLVAADYLDFCPLEIK